jgi:hypothetical protein
MPTMEALRRTPRNRSPTPRARVRAVVAVVACAVAAGCGSESPQRAKASTLPDAPDATDYAGCPSTISELAPGLVATGAMERSKVRLIAADPMPAAKYLNEWTLSLEDLDGAALPDAAITRLETFMPVHGHPGQPPAEAFPLESAGTVRAELHFTMRGPWEVRLDVASPSRGSDQVVFDVCVTE